MELEITNYKCKTTIFLLVIYVNEHTFNRKCINKTTTKMKQNHLQRIQLYFQYHKHFDLSNEMCMGIMLHITVNIKDQTNCAFLSPLITFRNNKCWIIKNKSRKCMQKQCYTQSKNFNTTTLCIQIKTKIMNQIKAKANNPKQKCVIHFKHTKFIDIFSIRTSTSAHLCQYSI